jgi:ribosomal protein S18 acetylase RimI-like enzyme
MPSRLASPQTVEFEPLDLDSLDRLRPFVFGFRFIHDGHFPQVPQDALADWLLADLRSNPEYTYLSGFALRGPKTVGAVLGKPLRWDTSHFGQQSARLSYAIAEHDDARIRGELVAWFLERGRQFGARHIAARCNLMDQPYLGILLDHRFRLVAVNMMLRHSMKEGRSQLHLPPGVEWSAFHPDMLDPLLAVMETDSLGSRFNADERFDRSLVQAMYRSWVRDLCGSHPDYLVVATKSGDVAGFAAATPSLPAYGVTALPNGKPALVSMVAVAPRFRGQALGAVLVTELVHRLGKSGFDAAYGQVSLRNPASFHTFVSAGFLPVSTVADLHWWEG